MLLCVANCRLGSGLGQRRDSSLYGAICSPGLVVNLPFLFLSFLLRTLSIHLNIRKTGIGMVPERLLRRAVRVRSGCDSALKRGCISGSAAQSLVCQPEIVPKTVYGLVCQPEIVPKTAAPVDGSLPSRMVCRGRVLQFRPAVQHTSRAIRTNRPAPARLTNRPAPARRTSRPAPPRRSSGLGRTS